MAKTIQIFQKQGNPISVDFADSDPTDDDIHALIVAEGFEPTDVKVLPYAKGKPIAETQPVGEKVDTKIGFLKYAPEPSVGGFISEKVGEYEKGLKGTYDPVDVGALGRYEKESLKQYVMPRELGGIKGEEIAGQALMGAAMGAALPETIVGVGALGARGFAGEGLKQAGKELAEAGMSMLPKGIVANVLARTGLASEGAVTFGGSEALGQLTDKYTGSKATGDAVRLLSGVGIGIKAAEFNASMKSSDPLTKFAKSTGKDFEAIEDLHGFILDFRNAQLQETKNLINAIEKKTEQDIADIMEKATQRAYQVEGQSAARAKEGALFKTSEAAKIYAVAEKTVIKLKRDKKATIAKMSQDMKANREALNTAITDLQYKIVAKEEAAGSFSMTFPGSKMPLSEAGDLLQNTGKKQYNVLGQALKDVNIVKIDRDAQVAGRESKKEFVSNEPAIKELVENIDLQIGEGIGEVAEQVTGRALITRKPIINELKTLKEELLGKPIKNDNGEIVGRISPSYNEIDSIRREVGDVFKKKESGGARAMDDVWAKKVYNALGDAQRTYLGGKGGVPDLLLKAQHEILAEKGKFKTKVGKTLIDTEQFASDFATTSPKNVPEFIFGDSSHTQQMITLINPEDLPQVKLAAESYIFNRLRDKDFVKSVEWFRDPENMKMLKIMGLKDKVSSYLISLRRIENETEALKRQLTAKTEQGKLVSHEAERSIASELETELETATKEIMRPATALAKSKLEEAKKLAKQDIEIGKGIAKGEMEKGKTLVSERQAKSTTEIAELEAGIKGKYERYIKSETPVDAIRPIFEGKHTKENMRFIGEMIATKPEAREAFIKSLYEMDFESIKKAWVNNELGKSIKKANLVPDKEFDAMDKAIRKLLEEPEKLKIHPVYDALWKLFYYKLPIAGRIMASGSKNIVAPLRGQRGAIGGGSALQLKPNFFSQLEKTISEKIQTDKPLTPDQFMGVLKPEYGIKTDELKNTGILDFLHGKKLVNEKVSKRDVVDYVKEKTAKFEDVTLESQPSARIEYNREFEVINEKMRKKLTINKDSGIEKSLEMLNKYSEDLVTLAEKKIKEATDILGDVTIPKKINRNLDDMRIGVGKLKASTDLRKYHVVEEYAMQNGTYREIMHTLESLTRKKFNDKSPKYSKYVEAGGENYKEMFVTYGGGVEGDLPKGWPKSLNETWKDGHNEYKDIKNPIIRIRLNDRLGGLMQSDLPGFKAKTLFIEEMQPPLANQGVQPPDWLQRRAYDIGIKRITKYAADNGYSRIAWANGDMQIKRYEGHGEGLEALYDDIIPKKFKEITKQTPKSMLISFGDYSDTVKYIDVPQKAKEGFPLYMNPLAMAGAASGAGFYLANKDKK